MLLKETDIILENNLGHTNVRMILGAWCRTLHANFYIVVFMRNEIHWY